METPEYLFSECRSRRNLQSWFPLALCLSILFHLSLFTVLKHISIIPDSFSPGEVSELIVMLVTKEAAIPEAVPEAPPINRIPVPVLTHDEGSHPAEMGSDSQVSQEMIPPEVDLDEIRGAIPIPPEEVPYPDAQSLIEQSYNAGRALAKDMESLVGPTEVFDPHFRETLENARRQQNHWAETMRPTRERFVGNNQMGDRIIRSGDTCLIIPVSLLYFQLFKGVTVLAMPDPACKKPDKNPLELSRRSTHP